MKIKTVISFVIASAIIMTSTPVNAYEKYGFSYNAKKYNVEWKKKEYLTVKTSEGDELGTLTYVVGVGRLKKSNDYVVMTRKTMTPYRTKIADMGLLRKGYGMSEYVSVKTTLPSLDNYQPQNDPSSDKVNLSIGVSADKAASVGLAYEIKHKSLDITSKCNTPKRLFHIAYNYKPELVNPFGSNKYLANESNQLAEAQFEVNSDTVSFKVEYDARFGAAGDKACSPLLVWAGYVKSKIGTKSYSFSLSKK